MKSVPRISIRKHHVILIVTFALASTTRLLCDLRRPQHADESAAPDSGVALSGPTMGSTWLVRLAHEPQGISPDAVQDQVQHTLDRIESEMSTWRNDSELSRFNHSRSTDWNPVSAETAAVVVKAREVSEQTGGAFDVTVGPLVNLWGFGPEHPAGPTGTLPGDDMLAEARKHVDYHKLEVRLDPPALRKTDPLVYADLSGIAKGYAAEQVSRLLDGMKIADYLVEVGGETRARGLSAAGRPWRVGIETPTPGTHRVLNSVALQDLSLSTSGDYRNYFDHDGKRYCHEIDPATGKPVENAPASVSVAHVSGAYADAMATAMMVLGYDKGMELARRQHIAALFIIRGEARFEGKTTPEFEKLLIQPLTQP